MSDPQIIRTADELAALDPDTLVNNFNDFLGFTADLSNGDGSIRTWAEIYLPVVVIATGDQVRAARRALGEAGRKPPTDDILPASVGLWQQLPSTWEEA